MLIIKNYVHLYFRNYIQSNSPDSKNCGAPEPEVVMTDVHQKV